MISKYVNTLRDPRIVGGLLVLLVFILSYLESVAVLLNLWSGREETIYDYGFLVVGCSVYLLYVKREQLLAARIKPQYWALLPAIVLVFSWFAFGLADISSLQLAVLPLILLTLVGVVYGKDLFRLSAIPILVLLFAVPMWWPSYPILKDATTAATELFLNLINKPVFVEGYYLHLPGGSFFVDDGCAGLRFLLVTLILGFVTIDMQALSLRKSLLLMSIGVTLALVANWVRVITVVLVGDATRMEHRLVDDHNDLGWLVYGICVLLPFFVLINYVIDPEPVPRDAPASMGKHPDDNRRVVLPALVLATVVLLFGPSLDLLANRETDVVFDPALPGAASAWSGLEQSSRFAGNANWEPSYSGETSRETKVFSQGGSQVALHLVHYAFQSETADLINLGNQLADGEGWSEIPGTATSLQVSLEDGAEVQVNAVELRGANNTRILVWYWFEVGQFTTSSSSLAKVYQLLALFSGRHDANLLAVATRCTDRCSEQSEILELFLHDHFAAIKAGVSLNLPRM